MTTRLHGWLAADGVAIGLLSLLLPDDKPDSEIHAHAYMLMTFERVDRSEWPRPCEIEIRPKRARS